MSTAPRFLYPVVFKMHLLKHVNTRTNGPCIFIDGFLATRIDSAKLKKATLVGENA